MNDTAQNSPHRVTEIAFGLDRSTDERSLILFMERFASPELLATLIPRLTEHEIMSLLDQISALMKKHLREPEYHRLFLKDR